MHKVWILILLCPSIISCTWQGNNTRKSEAEHIDSLFALSLKQEKKFRIDDETRLQPAFMQYFTDENGVNVLSFLNMYNRSLYFYDYVDTAFMKRIKIEREGPNGILRPAGYYIKSCDSIYVFDMIKTELVLMDSLAHKKTVFSLRDNPDANWALYYPQYFLSTVNPIIELNNQLILTGYSPFSLPDENISKFRYTAFIDMNREDIRYQYTYPTELYGGNVNWEGGFATMVYPCLSPDGTLYHSFPVSHDIYERKDNSDTLLPIYAGVKNANTIHPIDHKQRGTPDKLIIENYLHEDLYGALIYDPFREMYYRFLTKGVPNADTHSPKEIKPIVVILLDNKFNYIGESTIGTEKEWNCNNAFITKEGLNIEYIDPDHIDEDYLTFKLFIPEAI